MYTHSYVECSWESNPSGNSEIPLREQGDKQAWTFWTKARSKSFSPQGEEPAAHLVVPRQGRSRDESSYKVDVFAANPRRDTVPVAWGKFNKRLKKHSPKITAQQNWRTESRWETASSTGADCLPHPVQVGFFMTCTPIIYLGFLDVSSGMPPHNTSRSEFA